METIYISGYYYSESYVSIACYWLNGNKTDLQYTDLDSWTNSIFFLIHLIYIWQVFLISPEDRPFGRMVCRMNYQDLIPPGTEKQMQ